MEINNTGWIRVLRFILPYLGVSAIFQLLGALILGIDPLEMDAGKSSIQELLIVFFNLIGVFVALWVFTVKADNENFIILGFQSKYFFKEFGSGFGVGILAIVAGYFLLIELNEIRFEGVLFKPGEILIMTALFLFVSLAEETVFRGYILRNLLISFNKYVALIISAILFTVIHLLNPHINLMGAFSLFCAGLLYGIGYLYTKKLWLPIAMHFSWNLFQALMGFNVSGHDVYSLIEFSLSDSHWINGGSFGFEGSIISIAVQVLIILGIVLVYKKRKHYDRSTKIH